MAAMNIRRAARSSILRIRAEVETEGYTADEVHVEHTMDNHIALVAGATDEELDAHEELLAQVEVAYGSAVTKLQRMRAGSNATAHSGGYDLLWAELKRRYDNPRRLVESHVNRLLDLPEQPALTQRNVRNVIDVVRSTLRALNVMGLATDHWDAIVYPIVLRKLPTSAVAHRSESFRHSVAAAENA
ncbi:PREDICTED: uncharacterized protein LOC108358024 isoform X2 [Rhagoletis zephyria]|uniref:uncharacterized protein LOC108358024 isoform X1 n=1 Tax=Rhagoletis zephyria TaxID=28612 RepID=UPI0008118FBD|nr:PREDICTED: uncharacterized protein LOC108358024 isoform X1 [Rhagoletis zephyria]XP_017464631.1 PREDICTED: uncharacterized protein LOC108358024 isoform X2 [Rhagoletis zephyria]